IARLDPRDIKELVANYRKPDVDHVVEKFVAYRMGPEIKAAVRQALLETISFQLSLHAEKLTDRGPSISATTPHRVTEPEPPVDPRAEPLPMFFPGMHSAGRPPGPKLPGAGIDLIAHNLPEPVLMTTDPYAYGELRDRREQYAAQLAWVQAQNRRAARYQEFEDHGGREIRLAFRPMVFDRYESWVAQNGAR